MIVETLSLYDANVGNSAEFWRYFRFFSEPPWLKEIYLSTWYLPKSSNVFKSISVVTGSGHLPSMNGSGIGTSVPMRNTQVPCPSSIGVPSLAFHSRWWRCLQKLSRWAYLSILSSPSYPSELLLTHFFLLSCSWLLQMCYRWLLHKSLPCDCKSCRRFHQTLPNLGSIFGLRTSFVSIDIRTYWAHPKLGRVAHPNLR